MVKKILSLVGLSIILASASYAFTNGGGKSAAAPGQAKAVANCVDNILKQNANGVTGAQTGNDNDPKQANTAVTNCDHFWT